ncbi:hypothetical protein Poli38472_012346 [Pythium oligandrum]|uniref:Uncharacterized protein n=1 Tax=Pythium oligandrum TaxID=41045 RepID=A0A8K1FKL0_PYTOL|nr:hypothetical protein Poli38472_012346 [Pythium oligandrum]|eukprot:TMW67230.1 hypothetical protein Poli38472_012346 [Pythium oligandrum]
MMPVPTKTRRRARSTDTTSTLEASDDSPLHSEDDKQALVPRKKPRSTYGARKNETQQLKDEIHTLLARLQELQACQFANDASRQQALLRQAVLTSGVKQTELFLAGTQSLLSGRHVNPLQTHIHLPSDPFLRRQVLKALRTPQLHDAATFIRERVRFLDLTCLQRDTHAAETSEGDSVISVCDVVPFSDISTSVEEVYDQLLAFMAYREFDIFEYTDIMTICESEDTMKDKHVRQFRFLSTTHDVDVEKNVVHFLRSPEDDDVSGLFKGRKFGMVVANNVAKDELFPYCTSQRLRADVTAVSLVCESDFAQDKKSESPSVCVVRWSFVRIHHAQNGIPRELELSARENLRRWSEVMPKVLREMVQRKRQAEK